MKTLVYTILLLFLASCSSMRMTDSWKSESYATYTPKKVLVVGITQNLTARKIFEESLKKELAARGIESEESYNLFSSSFTSTKQTEAEIENELDKFSGDGFDTILISAVKGVDERTNYSMPYSQSGLYLTRFGRYYYAYQDIYYNPGYYDRYKIYHLETSLFDITQKDEKSLVWVAAYDLVDPHDISRTVNDYVKRITRSLEKERLLPVK